MNLQGELKRIIKAAERQGFTHELLGSGHHRFYAPDKQTIIQCSATTRDGAWKGKFLADMRKAGYKSQQQLKQDKRVMNNAPHATTSLGDVLNHAQEQESAVIATMGPKIISPREPGKLQPAPRGMYSKIAREVLAKEPDRYISAADLTACIRSRGFDYDDNRAGQLLAALVVQKCAERGDIGHYRRARQLRPVLPTLPPAPVQVDLSLETSDDDIAELDAALAALGRIETVVRKYRGVIKQIRAVKAALEGVK